MVNGGKRANTTVEGVDFQAREIADATDASVTHDVISVGPQSELTIVGPQEIVSHATIVPADSLSDAGFDEVGNTELRLVQAPDDPNKYVELTSETWQPVINQDEIDANGFLAPSDQMGERTEQQVNGVAIAGRNLHAGQRRSL